ncbi:MAG TPA: IS66 family insertion sequence element accessory protein TnpB [Verrucomicrobiae bacterium]|nr:IS66 family insertion sequence element accessory protein TnpB [Verrucomicrobiae bacterium]
MKTPLARREQLLNEFGRSGLTGKKFAELVGVRYQTFANWAQKQRRARIAYPAIKRPKQLHKAEMVVEPNNSDKNPLVLELPGGAKVEIGDEQQAALTAASLGR